MIFIPLTIGAIYFFIIMGFRPLNPENIYWMQTGDTWQSYFGWAFFRNTPLTFPPGLNPALSASPGLPLIYTDSIPLLAFLFKPLTAILPTPFQYHGWWLFSCFILQSYFGWKIVNIYTNKLIILIPASSLFCFSYPFIARLLGNYSLVGHFFILYSLYLCLNNYVSLRFFKWFIVLILSISIHFYIFGMCGLLWMAQVLEFVINKRINLKQLILISFLTVAGVFFSAWCCGYFVYGKLSDWALSFGFYKINLLSIFDPNDWSLFVNDFIKSKNEDIFDGFMYLGVGYIILIAFAFPVLISFKKILVNIKHKIFLFICLILLTLFSLSYKIGIGPFQITFYHPEFLDHYLGIVRSSGRFFWPVYYSIIIYSIYILIRNYKPNICALLLTICLFLQVLDSSVLWKKYIEFNNDFESVQLNDLKDHFWFDAAMKYNKISEIPFRPLSLYWPKFLPYALDFGLDTEIVYQNRAGKKQLADITYKNSLMLSEGIIDRDTIYILDDLSSQALKKYIQPNDLLTRIDGMTVFAPDWFIKPNREKGYKFPFLDTLPAESQLRFLDKKVDAKIYNFGKYGRSRQFLISGWSYQENMGVWSVGGSNPSILELPCQDENFKTVVLLLKPYLFQGHKTRKIGITIGDQPPEYFELKDIEKLKIRGEPINKTLLIKFHTPPTHTHIYDLDEAHEKAEDGRNLGIFLFEVLVLNN